ncbi:MAG: DUF116 domain-containing protein [Candidatus Latescibacterota bacterium]|nr:MAG: DUF116 domain-containing protein [Candidatus Latescibacterota bacterium]
MSSTADKRSRDRVLGDEWLDWHGSDEPSEIREGKRTFLVLSLVALVGFVLLAALFWYLVLPRFEQFGRPYAAAFTAAVAAGAVFFLVWYALLAAAVLSRRFYLAVCMSRGRRLLFILFPVVARLASSLGISRDRIGHSFIAVSNRLAEASPGRGAVLALLPRCLSAEIKRELRDLCSAYPDVTLHTAPGGAEARAYIRDLRPRAIVAVACERDLMSGIHDVAPRIPVIGIPNVRPFGPCKETAIDVEAFREALEFFNKPS